MTEHLTADIAVIGAGSGGLSVAAGAVQMGAEVVLFESGKMGGDCLNYGCVPSKALLAAGHAAKASRSGDGFGVHPTEPEVDFQATHDHVHKVIAGIAPHDSVERFEGLGVRVVQERARFVSANELESESVRVRAKRIVIATGSTAAIPPIAGLAEVPVLTNETIFDLTERPEHLLVIGGGPIGVELAQAHRNLGSRVTVLEMMGILSKDDPDAVDVVRQQLLQDGVEIREHIAIEVVTTGPASIRVVLNHQNGQEFVDGTHLLVATGRKPNLDGLDLDAAGIEHTPKGITVDARLRTTNKKVFAIGDVAGGYQFTHVAAYHAGIVIRNALFRLPAKVSYRAVPWVTYTDPELAHVGQDEQQARAKHGDAVRVLKWPYAENDRARAESATNGFVKAFVGSRGRILGATIVGKNAGELLLPWVLALENKLKIGAMANVIAPYPTLSEVSKRAAGSYYTDTLFSPKTRRVVRLLQKFA